MRTLLLKLAFTLKQKFKTSAKLH